MIKVNLWICKVLNWSQDNIRKQGLNTWKEGLESAGKAFKNQGRCRLGCVVVNSASDPGFSSP